MQISYRDSGDTAALPDSSFPERPNRVEYEKSAVNGGKFGKIRQICTVATFCAVRLFSLVLVSVYWINRAVILFDRLIADGQPASLFLEFTALSLPNVIRMVLPMSAFAASVYVTNRLAFEGELVVMQATGYSPWRLARPVVMFGFIVWTFMMVLTQYLVP